MLEIDLENRVAVVTGGSRGIGRACDETLAQAGARCVIGYHDPRSAEEVDSMVEEIGRLGGEAVAYCGDLTVGANCREIVDLAVRNFGAVHVVVNNAGMWRRAEFETMTEAQLLETVELNLKTVFRVTQFAAKVMRNQPHGGTIIQIASTAGERGEAHYSHYAATKGATIAMVKSLARELGPRIRVNCVSPGWIETDMTADALQGDQRRSIERSIPLGRVGQPTDVANAVAYLSSDLASWVTGTVLRVNGGAVLVDE